MLKNEREIEIIKLLRSNSSVSLESLSQILGVSQNTVRRDLDRLDKLGMIKRVRGGAIFSKEQRGKDDLDWLVRQQTYSEEKKRIGRVCANLVEEGESIFLDAGTTIMEIAKQLGSIRNTMILTNAVNISMELAKNENVTVILTGGVFREISKSLVGSIVEDFIKSSVHVDKMFLSAGGVNVEDGVTNANIIEVSIKRAMIEVSKQVILAVTHDKVGRRSFAPIFPLDKIDLLVTDSKADTALLEDISARGVEIITA